MPVSITSFTVSKPFHIFLPWFDFSSPALSRYLTFCLLLCTSQFSLQSLNTLRKASTEHSYIAVYINITVDNSLGLVVAF